jgi:hypothetical protein
MPVAVTFQSRRLVKRPCRVLQGAVWENYGDLIPSHEMPVPGLYLANTTQICTEGRGLNYCVRLGDKIASLAIARPIIPAASPFLIVVEWARFSTMTCLERQGEARGTRWTSYAFDQGHC